VIIIVDIDGTLANIGHRRHFMEQEKKDWDSFYKEMHKDKPNYWCTQLIVKMTPYYEIILLSGRPDNYRNITEQWLKEWNIPYKELIMRKSGDFRKDAIIKEELFDQHLNNKEILFVVDDRQQVVDMWRKKGLTCLQCDEGDY
jgi:hypothetical protein